MWHRQIKACVTFLGFSAALGAPVRPLLADDDPPRHHVQSEEVGDHDSDPGNDELPVTPPRPSQGSHSPDVSSPSVPVETPVTRVGRPPASSTNPPPKNSTHSPTTSGSKRPEGDVKLGRAPADKVFQKQQRFKKPDGTWSDWYNPSDKIYTYGQLRKEQKSNLVTDITTDPRVRPDTDTRFIEVDKIPGSNMQSRDRSNLRNTSSAEPPAAPTKIVVDNALGKNSAGVDPGAASTAPAKDAPQKWKSEVIGDGGRIVKTLGEFNSYDEAQKASLKWSRENPNDLRLTREIETSPGTASKSSGTTSADGKAAGSKSLTPQERLLNSVRQAPKSQVPDRPGSTVPKKAPLTPQERLLNSVKPATPAKPLPTNPLIKGSTPDHKNVIGAPSGTRGAAASPAPATPAAKPYQVKLHDGRTYAFENKQKAEAYASQINANPKWRATLSTAGGSATHSAAANGAQAGTAAGKSATPSAAPKVGNSNRPAITSHPAMAAQKPGSQTGAATRPAPARQPSQAARPQTATNGAMAHQAPRVAHSGIPQSRPSVPAARPQHSTPSSGRTTNHATNSAVQPHVQPSRPSAAVARPSYRSTTPAARPNVQPSRPSVSTARPSNRPTQAARPAYRPSSPSVARPSNRPSSPSTARPSYRSSAPSVARPSYRPSAPAAARPSYRPSAPSVSRPTYRSPAPAASRPAYRPPVAQYRAPASRPSVSRPPVANRRR